MKNLHLKNLSTCTVCLTLFLSLWALPVQAQLGGFLKDLKKAAESGKQAPAQTGSAPAPAPQPAGEAAPAVANTANTNASPQQAAGSVPTENLANGVKKYTVLGGRHTIIETGEAQLILTRSKANSFADAQAKRVTSVKGGEHLWLYLKTNKPFHKYAGGNVDNPSSLMELFFQMGLAFETGGAGPISSTQGFARQGFAQCVLALKPSENNLNEMAIQLIPGFFRAIQPTNSRENIKESRFQCMDTIVNDTEDKRIKRGVHAYEVYFSDSANETHTSNGRQAVIATRAPLTLDVSDGFQKFRDQIEAQDACNAMHPSKQKSHPECAVR
jgi:hypothetical protein